MRELIVDPVKLFAPSSPILETLIEVGTIVSSIDDLCYETPLAVPLNFCKLVSR
jgi:hypothetical protein